MVMKKVNQWVDDLPWSTDFHHFFHPIPFSITHRTPSSISSSPDPTQPSIYHCSDIIPHPSQSTAHTFVDPFKQSFKMISSDIQKLPYIIDNDFKSSLPFFHKPDLNQASLNPKSLIDFHIQNNSNYPFGILADSLGKKDIITWNEFGSAIISLARDYINLFNLMPRTHLLWLSSRVVNR